MKTPIVVFIHCVKSVQIRSFSGPYFPVFEVNTGKYGQENLRIWKLLAQCLLRKLKAHMLLIKNIQASNGLDYTAQKIKVSI